MGNSWDSHSLRQFMSGCRLMPDSHKVVSKWVTDNLHRLMTSNHKAGNQDKTKK
jgi:hypothetical protein